MSPTVELTPLTMIFVCGNRIGYTPIPEERIIGLSPSFFFVSKGHVDPKFVFKFDFCEKKNASFTISLFYYSIRE